MLLACDIIFYVRFGILIMTFSLTIDSFWLYYMICLRGVCLVLSLYSVVVHCQGNLVIPFEYKRRWHFFHHGREEFNHETSGLLSSIIYFVFVCIPWMCRISIILEHWYCVRFLLNRGSNLNYFCVVRKSTLRKDKAGYINVLMFSFFRLFSDGIIDNAGNVQFHGTLSILIVLFHMKR